MTRYRYKALDLDGTPRAGSVDAATIAQAEAMLAAQGLTAVDVAPDPSHHRPLSDVEVTEFLDQLSALTRAGTPLPGGLRAAAAEVESAPLRATLAALADRLDRGQAIDAALVDAAGEFPAHLQGLVHAGVQTGRLADVLGELVQASNLGAELRRQLRTQLAYPAVLLTVVAGLTIFICHVSHQVVDLTASAGLGIQPPVSLQVTVAINEFIVTYDGWIALGAAAAVGVGVLSWRAGLSPARRHEWVASIPLYGPLIRSVNLAEFCHLAGLLVEASLPLPTALHLAGGSVRDPSLEAACGRVASGVASGQTVARSLRQWLGLPAGLGQLLAWGEGQRELAGTLRFAGDMFEARAEAQAAWTGRVVGSFLMVLVLWWLGFAIASVYLPMVHAIQLMSALAG